MSAELERTKAENDYSTVEMVSRALSILTARALPDNTL